MTGQSGLSRRAFLGSLVLGAAGCSRIVDEVTQPDLPDNLNPPGGAERHPIAHLLNRAAYGATPGQIAEVERIGKAAWLAQQLDYKAISDFDIDLKLNRYDTLQLQNQDLMSFTGISNRRYVAYELAVSTLIRAVYSKRQLFEVMVGFWSDHFSIYHFKGDVYMLKTADDRDVIRRYALGTFGDLLRASAHSPAMLIYLDNILNEKSHPNENYAREIMELHTLGVDGGYTETDIQEVARCFTGWSVNGSGKFEFIPEWHDEGEKTVLGQTIRADDLKSDGDRVLDILLAHPSTARYVCTKLVRRIVADEPPPEVVEACIRTWQNTDASIPDILQTIFNHPLFDTAPLKLKRPFELLVSLLRATNARYNGATSLIDRLDRLGHRPFAWTTPDGYPDTAQEWSGNLVQRWNLCLDAISGAVDGVSINLDDLEAAGNTDDALAFFGRLFFKRDLTPEETSIFNQQPDFITQLGLMVASPAFQWR